MVNYSGRFLLNLGNPFSTWGPKAFKTVIFEGSF